MSRTPIPTVSPQGSGGENTSAAGWNETANASGEVAARVGVERVPVVVEQGPVWLARLAYDPPAWLDTALTLVVVATIGLAALGYYRRGIDEAVLREMGTAALTVVCVLGVAAVVRGVAVPGGYVTKALGAGVCGWVLAQLVASGIERVTEGTPHD